MSKTAKILIVEDDNNISFGLKKLFERGGHDVETVDTGEHGVDFLQKDVFDVVLLDINLPKMNGFEVLEKINEIEPMPIVFMITAQHDTPEIVKAMRAGAYDYFPKPFDNHVVIQKVNKALDGLHLKREVIALKRQQQEKFPTNMLIGTSPQMLHVKELIDAIANTPRTPALIQGESGTGKELVAEAIHKSGLRAEKELVTVNCSAIPDQLLESELFGHEKGAFTDAKTLKKGIFELANGGTIFLDEISSMKMALQPKILRVLETQSFRRIGGTQDIKVDVRVVAASNQNLERMIAEGEFREDLLYRLKVIPIDLPPLRDRRGDILSLAKIFLVAKNKEFNKNILKISSEAEQLLLTYGWPGNVRELRNVIERAAILCRGTAILPEHLPMELKGNYKSVAFSAKAVSGAQSEPVIEPSVPAPTAPPAGPSLPKTGDMSLQEMERIHIIQVLEQNGGNKSKAARILQISRSTLREKLKAYGIA